MTSRTNGRTGAALAPVDTGPSRRPMGDASLERRHRRRRRPRQIIQSREDILIEAYVLL